MVVALGFLFYFMMSQGGNNKAFQFGKNRAKLYKENGKNIKFEDVAGLKEEKEELEEIVDDIVNGYDDLIVQACGESLDALDTKPKVLMIVVSCIDDLLGTNHQTQ